MSLERQATLSAARTGTFCAIDFETATPSRASACALAVVRVERNRVTEEWSTLIRPPEGRVDPYFTRIHGITEKDVSDAPDFATAWKEARRKMQGSRFLAAHNASFDASVVSAECEFSGVLRPRVPFLCTVQVARQAWGLFPTKLPNVAQALGLPLQHHHAASDARACAEIVLAWRRRQTVTTPDQGRS